MSETNPTLTKTPEFLNTLTFEEADSEGIENVVVRNEEYARNGDFHRNLNPNWSYFPIYLNKLEVVDELLKRYANPYGKTLDAGCGEGVLVEKYALKGMDIVGVDKNYASANIVQGSLTEIPFPNHAFSNVLCLDVLEHLPLLEQPQALQELKRVLNPPGTLIVSIPNLAHFTARLKFMFRGKLLRTASIYHHPGDRTARDYELLLNEAGFEVIAKRGIFPTLPFMYRHVMSNPSKCVGLLRTLRKMPFPVYWNFQVLFVCRMKA